MNLHAGAGFGFICTTDMVACGVYFQRRRSLAYGLATSGVGLGNIILPWVTTYLIKIYGWRGMPGDGDGSQLEVTLHFSSQSHFTHKFWASHLSIHNCSIYHRARKYGKLMKTEHWNFCKIIAWKQKFQKSWQHIRIHIHRQILSRSIPRF